MFAVLEMKKHLLKYKTQLQEQGINEEEVYQLYIEEAFRTSDDIWEISEAFYYYNQKRRVKINRDKQSRNRVSSSDIHIATQFFTPKWLANYLIDNSLGRFFPKLEKEYCDGDFNFFMLSKDNITILDPAVGTGNMLLCAYDLLEKEYIAENIPPKQIPNLILSKFYGLDIDKRATDIAKKLLLKRAGIEEYDFNIYSFCRVSKSLLNYLKECGYSNLYKLLKTLNDTIELGSIIKLYNGVESDINEVFHIADIKSDKETLSAILVMARHYDIILMNPPYLTSSDYNLVLKEYIYDNYSDYKQDLFAVFISKYVELLTENGFLGVVCPYNWMFIKSFTQLRKLIIKSTSIYNLLQLSSSGYSKAVVYLSAFVVGNIEQESGYYIRLNNFKASQQMAMAKNAINQDIHYRYFVNQQTFLKTPNNSMIYWLNSTFLSNFKHKRLCHYLEIRQGMATGDNKRFLRKITDVDSYEVAFDAVSLEDFNKKSKKYAPYNKGGKYKKWFGNIDYVIDFDKDAQEILAKQGNKMPSSKFYFKECITWTLVSSKGHFGARYSNNAVFDVGGSCGFIKESSPVSLFVILGFLCSKVATCYLNALNPTLNVQVGDIKNIPFIVPSTKEIKEIEWLVKENIDISKKDWYNVKGENFFKRLKQNEERLNEIFINLYGLADILNKEVIDNLITVRRDDEE